MDILYTKNTDRKYMILNHVEEDKAEEYETAMLETNEIRSLLPFYLVSHNGNRQYWYDCTGVRSLQDYIEEEGLSRQSLSDIITYMGAAFHEVRNYLIGEEHLVLTPETICLKRTGAGLEVRLCYCPAWSEETESQVTSLLEFFLEKTDHENQELTETCYDLYRIATEEGGTFDTLAEAVNPMATSGGVRELAPEEQGRAGEQEKTYYSGYTEGTENGSEEGDSCRERRESYFGAAEETDDYSDPYSDNEEQSNGKMKTGRTSKFTEKIKSAFSGKIRKAKSKVRDDRHHAAEDFVYDPAEDFQEPKPVRRKEQRKWRLVYLPEQNQPKEEDYLIHREIFRVGTLKDNDAVLHSPVVSRLHAKIIREDDILYLRDENSRNGTYVNGTRVTFGTQVRLKAGDKIAFANVRYKLV